MHMCVGMFRVQKRASGPLEQELQVIVSHQRSPVYNIRNKDSRVSSSGYNMTTSLPPWSTDNLGFVVMAAEVSKATQQQLVPHQATVKGCCMLDGQSYLKF